MANYTPTFTKPYPNGWVDKPSKTTPVTAEIMGSYDTAIAALEAYLRDNAIKNVSADTTVNSGTKIATITIDGTEYVIYSPSVSYESAITGGTKVGTITVGTNTFDVYAPSSSAGGSTVSVVPKTLTGTNIAEITVDGTTYQLYAPTSGGGSGSTVTAEATLTEGAQIGKITIDGVETILYAPTASAITVDSELSATSENAIQNKVVKAEFDKVNDSLSSLGKCKNLLKPTLQTATQNGVTCTNNGDGTYTLNGTNTNDNFIYFRLTDFEYFTDFAKKTTNKDIKLVGCPTGGGDNTFDVQYEINNAPINGGGYDFGDGAIVKNDKIPSENITKAGVYIVVRGAITIRNKVFKPMLTTNLNATYDDFVPYTGDGDTLAADVAKLNSDVSNLKDGTTPVAKAVADEDGNDIKSTYAKKTEAFIDYSHISVDLNTLTAAPSLISIGYEAANKPSGFYGGYMFVVNAGYSASIALYQTLLDVFSNKTYQRKYYHGAWTDWEETNSGITIDSALSETSTNPVQNKVVTAKLNEVFQSVSEGKSKIAAAITDKGITTAADATFQVMADNILKLISGSDSNNNLGGNNFKTGIEMSVVLNFKAATWNVTTDYNPSVSASFGESIVTNWGGGSNIGINIFTVYPIDLTNIKSIKIKYTESAHYGDTFPFWLGITSTKYMTVVDPRNTEFDKKISNTATGETEITMDVSDISGQKYIYIMPIGYTCTITDLILEKNVDTRFEIAQPTEKLIGSYYSTLIYTQAGANYYAVKATDNTSKYWAIGFITRWSNWYVPVIVSNTADYAHVISTNTGSLSGIYTFEYENKTYYCNNGMQGAYEWTNPITYKAIPLYDVADSNFSGINTEAAWIYMAKKLLDFYFGKEAFPQ